MTMLSNTLKNTEYYITNSLPPVSDKHAAISPANINSYKT